MGQTWFGTRGYMQWVKAPTVGIQAGKTGWESQTQLLNGKKYVRRSLGAHKEYAMSWGLSARSDLQPIMDYADGIYGQGKIYWVDPFISDRNMLPLEWSAPFQGANGGTILTGGYKRPALVPTTPNTNGYPTQSALYTNDTDVPARKTVWLPIPPGYEMHLGMHGQAGSGAGVGFAKTSAGIAGAYTNLTVLPVTGTARTSHVVSSSDSDGVELRLTGVVGTTVTLTALTAVLLPVGASVAPVGRFISGGGHSGLSFASQPVLEQYSAAMDKVGLSITLIEDI